VKILFILHYPPPVHGSSIIGSYIKDSPIINEEFKCRYINVGTSNTIEEIGKGGFCKFFRYMVLIWQIEKHILTFRPNLCYFSLNTQGIGFYKDAVIVILVRIFGVKPVYHFHNKGVSLRQNKVIDNLLYHFVFRKAEVILLSKHLYPDIRKYVPENNVHYCPNGIPDVEESVERKAWSGERSAENREHDEDRIIRRKNDGAMSAIVEILFLSHLIESKGVFVLVDALKLLKDKDIDFHGTLIGGEGDITEMQLKSRIDAAGLGNRILVAGKKFGEEKQIAMRSADIFVLPTYQECMPLVLLEAMQHSLPVVSTFEGAIPDVVEDGVTGFLVLQRDAIALAEKIELLIKNPELRTSMGIAGRKRYENNFTISIFENRLKEILNAL
jgi:glycosyltransferase involved in cell wall biosynthesis